MVIISNSQIKRRNRWKSKFSQNLLLKAKNIYFRKKIQYLIGRNTILKGNKSTSNIFNVSKYQSLYWKKKLLIENFHSKPHGGQMYQLRK